MERGLGDGTGHGAPGGSVSVTLVLVIDQQQKKVNQILGLIRKRVGTKAENVITPLWFACAGHLLSERLT